MWRLHRYYLKEVLINAAITFLVLFAVVAVGDGERELGAHVVGVRYRAHHAQYPGLALRVGELHRDHRAETARKMIFDLLVSDQPERETAPDPVSESAAAIAPTLAPEPAAAGSASPGCRWW